MERLEGLVDNVGHIQHGQVKPFRSNSSESQES